MIMRRKDIKSKLSFAHGGAWKVAYADFVTGMMSLFLVLWILSQDEEVIIATTRFFRDPYKAGVPKSTPVEQKDARPGSMVDQIVGRSDTTMRNTDDTTSIDIDVLHRIAQDWYQRLKLHEIDDSTIQLEVTSEGLKVTLYHGDDKPLFEPTTAKLSSHGRKVMENGLVAFPTCSVYRVDSHTMSLEGKVENPIPTEWELSLYQAVEVTEALNHYSAGELSQKLERLRGMVPPSQTVFVFLISLIKIDELNLVSFLTSVMKTLLLSLESA